MNAPKKARRSSITVPKATLPTHHQQNLLYVSYPELEKTTKVYYSTQLVESPERYNLVELSRQRTAKESRVHNLRKRSMTHLFGISANRKNTLQAFDEVNSYTHLRQISQAQAIRLSLPARNRTADSEYAVLSAASQTKLLYTHPKAEEILGMSQAEHIKYNALRAKNIAHQMIDSKDVTGNTLITELPPDTWPDTVDTDVETDEKHDILSEREQQLLSTRATVCESDVAIDTEPSMKDNCSDYLTIDDLTIPHTTNKGRRKPRAEKLANLERQRLLAKIESACIPPNVKMTAAIGVREMMLKPVQSIPSTSITSSQILDKSTHSLKNVQSSTTYVNKLIRFCAETSYLPVVGNRENKIRHSNPSSHKFVTTETSTMKDLIHCIPDNITNMRRRSRESIMELSGSGGPRATDVLDVLVWSRRSTTT